MRLRNEPLEKASGGTSYAEERDDERVRRTRLGRVPLSLFVVHMPKKKKNLLGSELFGLVVEPFDHVDCDVR